MTGYESHRNKRSCRFKCILSLPTRPPSTCVRLVRQNTCMTRERCIFARTRDNSSYHPETIWIPCALTSIEGQRSSERGYSGCLTRISRKVKELIVELIDESFGKTNVLKEVSLHYCSGTIHGVVGDNGAGKSTLLNCLAGYISM